MKFNLDTGKFFVTHKPSRTPDLLNTTLEKLSDDLADALEAHNGLRKDDFAAKRIRRCINKPGYAVDARAY